MPKRRFITISEQVAAQLRQELGRGRWTTLMPGRHKLAGELGVSDQTAESALARLEREGILKSQGPGKRRVIKMAAGTVTSPSLRVAILVGEPADRRRDYLVEIKHDLAEAGHSAFFAPWFMPELGMNVRSIASRLKHTEADAWIVLSGSRSLLEWFIEHEVPAFAVFGRRQGLPIAGVGPNKSPAIAQATRRLIELGHRRLVYVTLRAQRMPRPGPSVQPFLDEMIAQGISPTSYNLPDWEESLESFQDCLQALFKHTPPTAMIVDEASFFVATMQFLLNNRLRVPEDVSLICTDGDPHFAWCRPSISHMRWDSAPVVRRAVRWMANVARGKSDMRQTLTKAEFFEGGTIGPAPRLR